MPNMSLGSFITHLTKVVAGLEHKTHEEHEALEEAAKAVEAEDVRQNYEQAIRRLNSPGITSGGSSDSNRLADWPAMDTGSVDCQQCN